MSAADSTGAAGSFAGGQVAVQAQSSIEARLEPVGKTSLLSIQPTGHGTRLIEWAQSNPAYISRELLTHGALLFRGFHDVGIEQFEQLGLVVCSELLRDNGEHSRSSIAEGVYTPVFYAPEKKLLWHNENSFNSRWPGKILFCCLKPAQTGGETPIVDSRKVFERIDLAIRQKFIEKKIMYTRTYQQDLGLDWQTIFQTTSRTEVEQRCRESQMEFGWKGDILTTRCVRPSVVRHGATGEMVWSNQALHWHPSCLDPEVRESLTELFGDDGLPRNCFYGDGSLILDSEIDHIRNVYQDLESSFSWKPGDVMLLDNVLTAHARNPFSGERKLLVTMGDMVSYDDLLFN